MNTIYENTWGTPKFNMNCCTHYSQDEKSWYLLPPRSFVFGLAFSFFPWIFTPDLCRNLANLPASPYDWSSEIKKSHPSYLEGRWANNRMRRKGDVPYLFCPQSIVLKLMLGWKPPFCADIELLNTIFQRVQVRNNSGQVEGTEVEK